MVTFHQAYVFYAKVVVVFNLILWCSSFASNLFISQWFHISRSTFALANHRDRARISIPSSSKQFNKNCRHMGKRVYVLDTPHQSSVGVYLMTDIAENSLKTLFRNPKSEREKAFSSSLFSMLKTVASLVAGEYHVLSSALPLLLSGV